MNPHWASIGESTSVLGVRFLHGVHRWLGRVPFRICLYPVVLYYWLSRPLVRRSSSEYLRRLQAAYRVFPVAPGWSHGLTHLLHFAETILDKLLATSGQYRMDSLSHQDQDALFAGRGAVLITAHMGCLELLRVAAEHRKGLRITILVHTAHAEAFNRLLKRLDPSSAVRLMQVTDFSPVTAMMLADRVAAGEMVAIAGDRVPVAGGRVVHVPFLGVPAPLPIGPYLLASLLGCPVYCIACMHHGAGYRIAIDKLADRIILPRGSRQLAFAGYAGEFARWMERQLRDSPYDWFNFFPFWDQTPHASEID